MFYHLTPYQYPSFSIIVLALTLLIYLVRRKRVYGTGVLIFALVTGILWSLGAALEIGFSSFPVKIIFLKLRQTGSIWLHFSWLIFIIQFTSQVRFHRARILFPLAAIALLFTGLAWTNESHLLFWRFIYFDAARTTRPLAYALGPAGLASFGYETALAIFCTILIIKRMTGARGQQFAQTVILLLITAIPVFGNIIDIIIQAGADFIQVTPLLYNLAAGLFLFSLLGYRLLNIFPIAYQDMIDGMPDGVLALSLENHVVHLNPTAEAILGLTNGELVGLPVEEALAGYPQLLNRCCRGTDETVQENIQLETSEGTSYYELHFSSLKDRYDHEIGQLMTMRNISKRVRAESATRQSQLLLRQSEEKYRSLVENINEVIFTINIEGTITYVNPVIERVLGTAPENLLGKQFRSLIHPDDMLLVETNLRKSLTDQSLITEFRIFDQNHEVRYIRAYTRPILQDNQVVGIQGVATDVTDSQRVEEALERRASQLALLNYIGEQIAAVIELKSMLDSATRLIQKHFGYYHVAIFTPNLERGELQMMATSGAFSDLFPEDHHLKYNQGMVGWAAVNKTTLLANDVRIEPHYTNFYPDKIQTRSELAVPILVGDKLVGVLDLQSPMVDAFDENDVRVMETIADQIAIAMENASLYEEVRRQLKDREHRENMLRVQRDLLVKLSSAKSLDETLQLAVENLSAELRASRVAISLVDWENQSIKPVVSLGYPLNRPNLPTSLDRSIAGRVARNAQPLLIPNVNADQTGLDFSPGTLTLLCVPLTSNGKVIGVISLESGLVNAFSYEDLRLVTILANSLVMLIERARLFEEVERARTELEKRATELEEANANLRELDRLKSQFLANMSHELRTPLNSIIGFSEVLVDELAGVLNGDQKEFTQDILDSGRHLLKLINDLLDFSKIEAGHLVLEPTTFEVRSLFEELRITISPLVEKKSQVLVFRQDGYLPPVYADHLRIKQVFLNLLGNANKFTPEKGTIAVSCRCTEPDSLLFCVRDTGIGIRLEDQGLIFEEFRQVDGSLSREVSGSGLGLSISKRIVEMHHGNIWVESDLGEGSAFYVSLPVNCPGSQA